MFKLKRNNKSFVIFIQWRNAPVGGCGIQATGVLPDDPPLQQSFGCEKGP